MASVISLMARSQAELSVSSSTSSMFDSDAENKPPLPIHIPQPRSPASLRRHHGSPPPPPSLSLSPTGSPSFGRSPRQGDDRLWAGSPNKNGSAASCPHSKRQVLAELHIPAQVSDQDSKAEVGESLELEILSTPHQVYFAPSPSLLSLQSSYARKIQHHRSPYPGLRLVSGPPLSPSLHPSAWMDDIDVPRDVTEDEEKGEIPADEGIEVAGEGYDGFVDLYIHSRTPSGSSYASTLSNSSSSAGAPSETPILHPHFPSIAPFPSFRRSRTTDKLSRHLGISIDEVKAIQSIHKRYPQSCSIGCERDVQREIFRNEEPTEKPRKFKGSKGKGKRKLGSVDLDEKIARLIETDRFVSDELRKMGL